MKMTDFKIGDMEIYSVNDFLGVKGNSYYDDPETCQFEMHGDAIVSWIKYLIDFSRYIVFWTRKDNPSYTPIKESSCITEIQSKIESGDLPEHLYWKILIFKFIEDDSSWNNICVDYRMTKLKYLLSFLRKCPDESKYEHEKYLYMIFNIVYEHLEYLGM